MAVGFCLSGKSTQVVTLLGFYYVDSSSNLDTPLQTSQTPGHAWVDTFVTERCIFTFFKFHLVEYFLVHAGIHNIRSKSDIDLYLLKTKTLVSCNNAPVYYHEHNILEFPSRLPVKMINLVHKEKTGHC